MGLSLLLSVGCPKVADDETDTDTDTDTDTGDPNTGIVDCGVELSEIEGEVCTVTAPGTEGMRIRGEVLLPESVLLGGTVLVDAEGTIVCAACDCSEEESALAATEVDCAQGVISPGLINPHDHIGYTEGWPIDHGETRYEHRHDWRGSLSTPRNSDSTNGRRWGEIRQVISGTTAMVGSGSEEGLVRNLDQYSGLEGLDATPVENETFPLGDANEQFKSNCGWNYSLNAAQIARESSYIPHIAEGIDSYAAEEFLCQSGADANGEDTTEPNTAHVHGIGLHTVDYYRMAREHAQLVWSPRSNISLYGYTAQVSSLHQFGGVIALGTDWTYSGSIHMGRELACADSLNKNHFDGAFSDADLWRMATLNGAIATGTSDTLGSLEVGKVADIAVYDGSVAERYRAVIDMGPQGAEMVLRGGDFLYGAASLASSLAAGCETLDVCGSPRVICAEAEYGLSYSQIRTSVADAYPAFFCDEAPTDEPTCIPSHPGKFTGEVTDTDQDGDGVNDAEDNCSLMFNPTRPIDDGVQEDADGDGVGDVCDETPLLADLDEDSVENDADNCPFVSNNGQEDEDGDGRGDACDACPDVANPDSPCPEKVVDTTVQDIRTDGALSEGDRVGITGVVVTGLGDSGFMIQDPADSDGKHSGLYIYTSSTPTVSKADVLDIVGYIGDYFGEAQLQDPEITVTSAGTGNIDPIDLTAAEAATESYEGVLVRISSATVTELNYDCSVDGSSCSDEGLWELDGSAGVLVFDRLYESSDWEAQKGELPVVGVMNYRWNRRRVMPRTSTDFGG
jgi:cytosine/adenosine deaminase-related metal-dependent hydrolase